MEHKKAKRFLEAAQQDYDHAIFWYVAMIGSKADGPEFIERARRGVLEAQQVLELAQRELDDVQRHKRMGQGDTSKRLGQGERYADGVCEECGRTAPRWFVGDSVHPRALCAECGRAE